MEVGSLMELGRNTRRKIMIIYKATNKINGSVYIGKTVQLLSKRKNRHKFSSENLNNKNYFYNAIRKYGWDNFEWEILCEGIDSESKLNAIEKLYIATYGKMVNIYNMTKGGDGTSGLTAWNKGKKCPQFSGENHHFYGKRHSEITKKKISKSKKGNSKPNSGSFKKGNVLSKDTREKLKGRIPWNKGNGDYMAGDKNHFFGHIHSEETKQKISKTKKGNSPAPNKGKHLSKKTKQKLRDFNLGKCHTKETKEKISKSLKKRKLSPEIYKKIAKTRKANGYTHSEETRKKISKSLKEYNSKINRPKKIIIKKEKCSRAGINNPWYGKKHTEESKRKMSESHKGKQGYWTGKKRFITIEHRRKLSESGKLYWKNKKLSEEKDGIFSDCNYGV